MADTQAAPQLAKALSGVLPDGAIRQLMQALGNCNQPYTSRATQNFQPNEFAGNTNGVYGGGAWNPSQYPGLLPAAGSGGFTELPGQGGWTGGNYTGGAWNTSNYGGNSFSFPTNQAFTLNNYYGGPTFTVGGNSNFNNVGANTVSANHVAANTLSVGGFGFFGGGPQDPSIPGLPPTGSPGVPGSGGPGGLPVFPPIWLGSSGVATGQFPNSGPRPPFTGEVTFKIPTNGTLEDDCKISFSFRDITRVVTVG